MLRAVLAAARPLVPWGWAINGATSVMGTVAATIIAIYGGFTTTFFAGAFTYAAAGALGVVVARSYAAKPVAAKPAAAAS